MDPSGRIAIIKMKKRGIDRNAAIKPTTGYEIDVLVGKEMRENNKGLLLLRPMYITFVEAAAWLCKLFSFF